MLARTRQPELMDNPALDAPSHRHALRGLARLNAASFAAETLWGELRRLMPGATRIRLLDVATGSGDIPLALHALARRRGVELDLTLADVSGQAIEEARSRAGAAEVAVETLVVDALADELPTGYDAVTCSLFLHHLDADDVIGLLRNLARAGRHLIISDLCRSRRGLALAAIASRTLTRSPIVHTDAVLSARAAWTVDELWSFAEQGGLASPRIRRVFPCRLLLTWSAR